jgi:hypothetical protein
MVKWAQTNSEVLHYSNIAHQCLKVMGDLRPFLALTLRNKTIACGWLVGLTQGRNAEQDFSIIPTAWRGSIILEAPAKNEALAICFLKTARFDSLRARWLLRAWNKGQPAALSRCGSRQKHSPMNQSSFIGVALTWLLCGGLAIDSYARSAGSGGSGAGAGSGHDGAHREDKERGGHCNN